MAQQSTPPPSVPSSTIPPSTAPPKPPHPAIPLAGSRLMSARVGDVINLLHALNDAGLEVVRTPDGVDHAPGMRNLAMGELFLILHIMGIHIDGNPAAAPPPPSDSRDPLVQEIEKMVISSARHRAINLFFTLTNGPLAAQPLVFEGSSSTVTPSSSIQSTKPPITLTKSTNNASVTALPSTSEPASDSTSDTVMPTGFVCISCNTYNPIRASEKPAYVVFCGTDVGVFDHWEDAQSLVSGISHACHRRYKTREEGEKAFNAAICAGKVRILPTPIAAPGAVAGPSYSQNTPSSSSSNGPSAGTLARADE